MTKRAIAVTISDNSKTGKVSATYASQSSCPTTCPFRGAGCYAERGLVGMQTRRLADGPPLEVAHHEASAIDRLPARRRPLRLHVVGDAPNEACARTIASAAERYTGRGGGRAWTYTHAWRDVMRRAWGQVSVLASIHDARQAWKARRRGYACALVVDTHPADGRAWKANGVRWIPCPEQTWGVQCIDCGLCMDSTRLFDTRAGIAFAKH